VRRVRPARAVRPKTTIDHPPPEALSARSVYGIAGPTAEVGAAVHMSGTGRSHRSAMLPTTLENLSSLPHSLVTARYAVHTPTPARVRRSACGACLGAPSRRPVSQTRPANTRDRETPAAELTPAGSGRPHPVQDTRRSRQRGPDCNAGNHRRAGIRPGHAFGPQVCQASADLP